MWELSSMLCAFILPVVFVQKVKEYKRLAKGGGVVVDSSDEEEKENWFYRGEEEYVWSGARIPRVPSEYNSRKLFHLWQDVLDPTRGIVQVISQIFRLNSVDISLRDFNLTPIEEFLWNVLHKYVKLMVNFWGARQNPLLPSPSWKIKNVSVNVKNLLLQMLLELPVFLILLYIWGRGKHLYV